MGSHKEHETISATNPDKRWETAVWFLKNYFYYLKYCMLGQKMFSMLISGHIKCKSKSCTEYRNCDSSEKTCYSFISECLFYWIYQNFT